MLSFIFQVLVQPIPYNLSNFQKIFRLILIRFIFSHGSQRFQHLQRKPPDEYTGQDWGNMLNGLARMPLFMKRYITPMMMEYTNHIKYFFYESMCVAPKNDVFALRKAKEPFFS